MRYRITPVQNLSFGFREPKDIGEENQVMM